MAFALGREEAVGGALRRIALELIDDSRTRLAALRKPDKDVHETRKNVKKLRAVLRLGRAGLGETVYQRDNPYLRDFNRRLALLRESFVHRKLLRAMQKRFADQLATLNLEPLERRLRRAHRKAMREFVDSASRRAEVDRELAVLAAAVSAWPQFEAGNRVLELGLKRIYQRGRAEFDVARRRPGTEVFHDWRKRVKYLWYHLRMLGACWPEVLDAQTAALDELAELLGDDHDLAVFEASVLAGEVELEPMKRKALLDGLMNRRRELARAALTLGARCYVETPGAFSRRMMGYWHQWRPGERDERPRQTGRQSNRVD